MCVGFWRKCSIVPVQLKIYHVNDSQSFRVAKGHQDVVSVLSFSMSITLSFLVSVLAFWAQYVFSTTSHWLLLTLTLNVSPFLHFILFIPCYRICDSTLGVSATCSRAAGRSAHLQSPSMIYVWRIFGMVKWSAVSLSPSVSPSDLLGLPRPSSRREAVQFSGSSQKDRCQCQPSSFRKKQPSLGRRKGWFSDNWSRASLQSGRGHLFDHPGNSSLSGPGSQLSWKYSKVWVERTAQIVQDCWDLLTIQARLQLIHVTHCGTTPARIQCSVCLSWDSKDKVLRTSLRPRSENLDKKEGTAERENDSCLPQASIIFFCLPVLK